MRIGDVIRVGKFDAVSDTVVLHYKAPSKTEGYVMMFLGVEPKDGSRQLDVMQIMDRLGWKPKDEP